MKRWNIEVSVPLARCEWSGVEATDADAALDLARAYANDAFPGRPIVGLSIELHVDDWYGRTS